MPIRAVLFDLGDTLVSYYQPQDFLPILRRSLDACLQALDQDPLSTDARTDLLHQALDLNQERADLAVWPLEERLQMLFGRYASLDAGLTERLVQMFLEPVLATAQVNHDALPVLLGLRRRGIKTGIVSNTPWGSPGRIWRSELARHQLLTAVDAVVFCQDVGWRKPHPTPFRRALEMIGVAPMDAAFVGDNPVWDVDGAESAGLLPILLGGRHPLHMSGRAIIAPALSDVLATIEQLNSTASTGPQPMLA
jgi:HAD superfamily hydrolase (TIGR01509 family)